jgi:hypothetical protein
MADYKYSNGKIYKIVDNTSDKVYIGSTCRSLVQRLTSHELDFRRYMNGKSYYNTSYDIIKNGNYRIELIENVNANNKEELYDRERYHIFNERNSINKIRLLNKTHEERVEQVKEISKQWYRQNKDKKLERTKTYYKNNVNKIKERAQTKYLCICGVCYTRQHKSHHCKTKRHQTYQTKHNQIINHINESFEIVEQLVNVIYNDDIEELKRLNECLSMGFEDKPI